MADTETLGHSLALLAALTLFAWSLRLLALHDAGLSPAACDLPGFLRDLAGALIVTAVGVVGSALGRLVARAVPIVVALLWGLLGWVQYEHVRALDAPIRFDNAGYLADPTFLRGSVLAPGHPLLVAASLALLGLVAAWAGRPRAGRRAVLAWAAVAAGGLALALLVPGSSACLGWRASAAFLAPGGIGESGNGPSAEAPIPPGLAADLAGTPHLPFPAAGKRPNVLLVLLEGVSGAYLPTLAERHGLPGGSAMAGLDAAAGEALLFSTFLYQQRQTNRGEYAVLCGDLPKLTAATARFSELGRWPHPCLPELLAEAGWHTVYLQAAPLGFMFKDQALPAAGFAEVHGDEWFARAYRRSGWGVDDHAFFEQSLEMIRRLRGEERPWFLTLLTVGTHHPFIVPEGLEVEVPPGASAEEEAFLHLDHAFAAFWAALREEDWLDDTLVIVTADEGWGVPAADPLARVMSQSLGFAAVHPPGGSAPTVVAEPYAQSDLALSVLDFLGLAAPTPPVGGRSLFRRYSRPRPLFFANVYQRRAFALLPGGRLVACGEGMAACRAWDVDPAAMFRRPPRETPPQEGERALLAGAVAHSLRGRHRAGEPAAGEDRTFPLVARPEVAVPDAGSRLVFGGQSLELAPGEVAEVELEIAVGPGGAGWTHASHDLLAGKEGVYRSRLPALGAGSRARLRYRYRAGDAPAVLETRLRVTRLAPGEVALALPRARLTIRPARPGEEAGTAVLVEEVERPGTPPTLRLAISDVAAGDRAECLRNAGFGALAGDPCPAGFLLSGPRFPAPWGSRVTVSASLTANTGGRARWVLGSEEIGVAVLEGPLQRLAPGRPTRVELAGEVDATLPQLQLGLLWQPAGEAGAVEIGELAVTVEWP